MPEPLPALTPAALAALLNKVDEVCAQAKALRMEIVNAMQRHRADDHPSRPRPTPKARKTRKSR